MSLLAGFSVPHSTQNNVRAFGKRIIGLGARLCVLPPGVSCDDPCCRKVRRS